MRILYIHQYFATPRGRTGTRSYEQARAMMAAGHEVTMVTTSAQLRDDEVPAGSGAIRRGVVGGVNCIVLTIPYDQRMSYLQRIVSFLKFMVYCCLIVLRERRPDVIFATSTPLTVGVPALVGKWFGGIPYFFEVRDPWPEMPMAMGIISNPLICRALKIFELMIYRHARVLIAVNATLGAAMLADIGGRKPLVVAPNACDTELFGPELDGSGFRSEHGLEGKALCVYTGAMGQANCLDFILDAAIEMADHADVHFLLIGEGREKAHLKERVAQENLSNVLILDAMPKEELTQALATVDVGILNLMPIPVMEQNGSNKYSDYLASGCAVIITHKGWQAELLDRYQAGLSSQQGDLAGLVANLRRLADDEPLRTEMARNARGLAETEMNRAVCVQRILDALAAFDSGRAMEPATAVSPR